MRTRLELLRPSILRAVEDREYADKTVMIPLITRKAPRKEHLRQALLPPGERPRHEFPAIFAFATSSAIEIHLRLQVQCVDYEEGAEATVLGIPLQESTPYPGLEMRQLYVLVKYFPHSGEGHIYLSREFYEFLMTRKLSTQAA